MIENGVESFQTCPLALLLLMDFHPSDCEVAPLCLLRNSTTGSGITACLPEIFRIDKLHCAVNKVLSIR
eukprot:scaffold2123_cov96-Cylindrotheca_fusiformis.AAC.4